MIPRFGREIESLDEVEIHKELIELALPFERCESCGEGLVRLGSVFERQDGSHGELCDMNGSRSCEL